VSLVTLQLFDTLLQKDDEHIIYNLVLRNLESRAYYQPMADPNMSSRSTRLKTDSGSDVDSVNTPQSKAVISENEELSSTQKERQDWKPTEPCNDSIEDNERESESREGDESRKDRSETEGNCDYKHSMKDLGRVLEDSLEEKIGMSG